MFNPEGTGIIAKQVKELLAMNKPETIVDADRSTVHKGGIVAKLTVLLPHIDWNKSNTDNARSLMQRLHEFHISSTEASIPNFIGVQRKKMGLNTHRRQTHPVVKVVKVSKGKADTGLDVAVQMLDDAIQSMKDMRVYLISTTEENNKLRARLDMFKKALEG
jgi:hypothetical protein